MSFVLYFYNKMQFQIAKIDDKFITLVYKLQEMIQETLHITKNQEQHIVLNSVKDTNNYVREQLKQPKSLDQVQQSLMNKLNVQFIAKQAQSNTKKTLNAKKKAQPQLELNLSNPEDRALQLALRMNKMRMQKQRKVQAQLQKFKKLKQQSKNKQTASNHSAIRNNSNSNRTPDIILTQPSNIIKSGRISSKIHQEVELLHKSILLNERNHIKKFVRQIFLQIAANVVDKLEKKKAFYFNKSPKFVSKSITIRNIRPNQYGPNNFSTIQHRYQNLNENNRSLKLKKIRGKNESLKYEFDEFADFTVEPAFLKNSFRTRILKQQKQKKKQQQQQVEKMHEMRQKMRRYNYHNLLKSKVTDKKIDEYIFSIVVSDPSHNKVSEELIRQVFGIKSDKASGQNNFDIGLALVTLQERLREEQEQIRKGSNSASSQKESRTIVGDLSDKQESIDKDSIKSQPNQNQKSEKQIESDNEENKKQDQQQDVNSQPSHKGSRLSESENQFRQIKSVEQQVLKSQNKSMLNQQVKQESWVKAQMKIQSIDRNDRQSQFSFNAIESRQNDENNQVKVSAQFEQGEATIKSKRSQLRSQQKKDHLKGLDGQDFKLVKQDSLIQQRQSQQVNKTEQKIINTPQKPSCVANYKQGDSIIEQSEIQEKSCYSNQVKLSRFLQVQSDSQFELIMPRQKKRDQSIQNRQHKIEIQQNK